jgi:hypothetical protein
MWRFRRSSASGRALACLAVLVYAALGCAGARDAASHAAYEANPFSSTDLTVKSVSLLEPYLLAEIVGRDERLRVLVPASPECSRVCQSEAAVRYQKSGNFGLLERGDARCDVVGIASLEAWRDRQPRRRARAEVLPRATARFAPVGGNDRHLIVRGRFPLASEIRVPSGADLVAVLPANDVCRSVVARGESTLEFRPAGRGPFRLLAGSDACVIEGFAMPIDAVGS